VAVALAVHREGVVTALGGFLRADALSAWMVALIGLVGALAATEAPRYASGRFYPLFHLFVFTMLLAVTTDDVGLMWVAVEGTTLASVFLVNFEGTRASREAPAPVSALMSGVLLSVGVSALLRFKPVVDLAAGPAFARRILLALGLASMAVAALFLWTSQNFKRMLAYSSVEHIGIACLGLGFGGAWGVTGALLHLANHALAKSALFVLAFAGLLRTTQTMLHGVPARPPVHPSLGAWPAVPVLVALLLLVLTGLAWPPGLALALDRIAAVVAG